MGQKNQEERGEARGTMVFKKPCCALSSSEDSSVARIVCRGGKSRASRRESQERMPMHRLVSVLKSFDRNGVDDFA
jgi:hypothetical protein